MKEGFISSSFLIIFRLHVNDKEVISLSSTNLLLQVTRLENTKFVYMPYVKTKANSLKDGYHQCKKLMKYMYLIQEVQITP